MPGGNSGINEITSWQEDYFPVGTNCESDFKSSNLQTEKCFLRENKQRNPQAKNVTCRERYNSGVFYLAHTVQMFTCTPEKTFL